FLSATLSSSVSPLSLHDALPILQAFWSLQSAAVEQGVQPAMAVLWQTPASQDSVVQAFWSLQSAGAVQGVQPAMGALWQTPASQDRKSTRLNSSHEWISYAVFCF